MSYSSYVLIVGLWGGPFLSPRLRLRPDRARRSADAAGDQPHRRRRALGPCRAAHSAPTSRWCSPARSRRAAALALLAALGKPEPCWLADLAHGVRLPAPPILPVLIAHGRSFLPPHLVGRGMTLFNIGTHGRDVRGAARERRADRSVSGAGRRLSARCLSRWCSPRRRLAFWSPARPMRRPTKAGVARACNPPGRIKDFPSSPSCILCGAVYVIAARYVICVAYRRPPWAFPP